MKVRFDNATSFAKLGKILQWLEPHLHRSGSALDNFAQLQVKKLMIETTRSGFVSAPSKNNEALNGRKNARKKLRFQEMKIKQFKNSGKLYDAFEANYRVLKPQNLNLLKMNIFATKRLHYEVQQYKTQYTTKQFRGKT